MADWIKQLLPIVEDFKDGDPEPLSCEDVDNLTRIFKAKINLHEGNITQDEYNDILNRAI
jgi:hypothetical protein